MANVSDKSILTAAGKALLAQLNAEEKALVIDKMIFANVPNRPEYPQPDDVVPTDNVVHQAAVEQRGRLSEDSVIYSTTLASNEGPFEFNWTGAYCSEYGVLVTIDHHSLTPKTVDEPGVSGNTLVRSVVLEYKDIAEITNITVDASTWQYNATPRMKKMDNDVAQANIDQNGKDWFIEEGFLVTPQASAFSIKAGAGYVSGNRVALEFDRSIQVPNKPSFIYIDAHREGTPTGEQVTLFNFVVSADEKDDYIDSSTGKDVPHFVCKIAQVLGDGSVSDLRPEGEVELNSRFNSQADTGTRQLRGTTQSLIGRVIAGHDCLYIKNENRDLDIMYMISPHRDGVIESIDLNLGQVVVDGEISYVEVAPKLKTASIESLRTMSPPAFSTVAVTDYYSGWAARKKMLGGGGDFYIDASDTATLDDGGMVIVCANGFRAKRIYIDKVYVDWFGASERHGESDAHLNVDAFTRCAKFCFEGKGQENSVPGMWFSATEAGGYKVNDTTPVPYNHIRMGSDGESRIRPISTGNKYPVFDNLDAVTERCVVDKVIFYMWDGFDPINLSYGINSAFRFRRLSRNAKLKITCIGGDTGLDLATNDDHWGIDLTDSRFESQKYPLRLDVNGQTFKVSGGMFNATVKAGTDVIIVGNSSQINFENVVFENDAVNTKYAGGKMLRISGNVQEVIFNSCQSERLGYIEGRTGEATDYDVFIDGASRITLINSRMWGGNYGSSEKGNSRNYGWYLKNASVKLISSRIYSFSGTALYGEGDCSISCDSKSQVDGRIKGQIKAVSNADLGKNQVSCPSMSRYELSRGQSVPLGWSHLEATTTPDSRLVSENLLERGSKYGLEFKSSIYTNFIKVERGDEIVLRFFGKFYGSNVELHTLKYDADGTIKLNNSGDPDFTLIKRFNVNSSGVDTGSCYFIIKHTIDTDVDFVCFLFSKPKYPDTQINYIEQPAIYVGTGVDWEEGSSYSDNDGTYGFRFYLGPLLPAIENGDLIAAKTDLKGYFRQGEMVRHQRTAVTEPLVSVCTETGLLDAQEVSMKVMLTK
ncbi:phage tail protein [Vibrio splendidus]|uniref:Phage tail protein n=1 Tax=Vibrio splendidus TaxID=29497 RepID=A0ABV4LRU2_VIBSP